MSTAYCWQGCNLPPRCRGSAGAGAVTQPPASRLLWNIVGLERMAQPARLEPSGFLRNATTSATNLGEVTRLWPSSGYMISRPLGIR